MSVLESKKVNPNLIAVGFLEYYYNLINSQAANLYQMYTKNATLNHSLKAFKKFENVKGIDNIKKFWNNSELRGAKFMIQTIDVEEVDEKSILLSCTGEFALPDPLDEDTPSQRFVHTFILFSENNSRYDVINEMLRVIPDIDDEDDEEDDSDGKIEESKEVEKVEAKDEIKTKAETIEPEGSKQKPKFSVAPAANGSVASTNKKSIEETEDQLFTSKETSKESTPETAPEVEEEKTSSTPPQLKKLPDLPSTPAKPPTSAQQTPSKTPATIPPKPAKPFSWADAASANAKKAVKATESTDPTSSASSINVTSANGHATTAAATTAVADKAALTSAAESLAVPAPSSLAASSKSEKKDSKNNTKNGSNASSSSGLGKSVNGDDNTEEGLLSKKLKKSFINKKGEAVYPIYIKGVERGITQQELISALEKKFGKVDSCKIESFIALVDFTEHQSQIDAIKVGTLKVKNTTIRLEPRVSKKESKSSGNGNSNNNHGNGNKSDNNNNNNNSNNNNNKKKKKNDKHNGSHIVNDSDGFQKVVK
ncbi:hypothetical protein B5S33_g1680 [[Candida] boidinii]|nr:hypothetical protein B5S33_g1680 [[Candida] boidinii]